jgi:hypothetical protein
MTPYLRSRIVPNKAAGGTRGPRRVFIAIAALGLILAPIAGAQVLDRADAAFLEDQARRIVASARLQAGGSSGKWRNDTPYDLHVPGGNMGYPAFWVRDAVMMLGGDLIPAAEVEGWIRLMAGTMNGPAERTIRPGVIVPAFAVPDHINFDGLPTFYPGNYETGDKQGGPPWGKYPPLDDHFYFIGAVYEHWRMTGKTTLFTSKLKTSYGEARLQDLCRKAYRVAPDDPATCLVIAGNVETENAKDWGFCDSVSKSGKLLFPSLLKYEAALRLAKLYDAVGEPGPAAEYRADAARIRAALMETFLRRSGDGDEAWLHSATGLGNQPDVWGSAFAVAIGALDEPAAGRVARALVRAYKQATAIRRGWVRHLLPADKTRGGFWEVCVSKPGEYQNGGYWGTPTGWVIAAIHRADPKAAADMARDFVASLRKSLRQDGTAEAWEWFNPDTGASSNPLYVATVALPYLSLKAAGLLSGPRPTTIR